MSAFLMETLCCRNSSAMQKMQYSVGLPHTKGKRDGLLSPADHAQKGIIDAAKYLGNDLSANW